MANPPADDVVEVTVLGRGVGESVVVHLGKQRWVIVDTFVGPGPRRAPAPLEYLDSIDVPAERVDAIVVTHYDADHYRGLDRLVDRCFRARLCTTAAVDPALFRRLRDLDRLDTFARTLSNTIDLAEHRLGAGGHRRLGPAQHPVLYPDAELMSIAPVDAAVNASVNALNVAANDRDVMSAKALLKRRNLCSVALHGRVGDATFLLCGDVLDDTTYGWQAVLSDPGIASLAPASLVKASHHGAESGHYQAMWNTVVTERPDVLVAPYTGGRAVPTEADIERLCGLARSVHQAATSSREAPRIHDDVVVRWSGEVGRITARKLGQDDWQFEHQQPAWQHDCTAISVKTPHLR